jgi:hypothetical protein
MTLAAGSAPTMPMPMTAAARKFRVLLHALTAGIVEVSWAQ